MTTRPVEAEQVACGLPTIGCVPWGTHLCHFYQSTDDLRDALVPYFRAGLEQGDKCLWVTCEPVSPDLARSWFAELEPRFHDYESRGQIEILDAGAWYCRSSGMNGDAVLRSWFDRIDEAIAEGFRGLRISGDTAWLERKDWASFTEYEAGVHRSFGGRRILALCSYPLNRCSVGDLLDVMRNHEFALIRRDGSWEAVHSAAHLVESIPCDEPEPSPEHAVHFFSENRFPAHAVADFLAEGLLHNSAAAIASESHLDQLREVLQARGLAWDGLRTYDATELIEALGEEKDVSHLRPFIADLIDELTAGGAKAFLYGELVDILSRDGQSARAVELERLWNEAIGDRPVALLCGYELSGFKDSDPQNYLGACGSHAQIRVDASPDDQRILAGALATELKTRRELKTALEALRAENLRRKAAERRLQFKTQELERSNAALQDFAFVASHDLREPLRKVLLFGKFLSDTLRERLKDKEQDYLQRMLSAAERMDLLVRDLLDYSRISRAPRLYAGVDLAVIVRESVSNLEEIMREVGGAIEIGPLPTLEADAAQLRRLFQNLIQNALKFRGSHESPRVTVREEPSSAEGTRRIVVEDHGIGFEQRHAERIFQLFQRLHGRSEFSGSGLGLAICRRIVEQHGGRIWAEGEPGRGARFFIELPERQISSSDLTSEAECSDSGPCRR